MKNLQTFRAKATVTVGLVGLLLTSCGSDSKSSDNTKASNSASSAAPSIETSQPSTTQPIETSPPTTAVPTLPPGPPVFDPQTIGSNMTLPNFIVTVTVANTNSGQLTETVTTSGYINDPLSVYKLATFASDGTTPGGTRNYLINGRSYEENNFGDWYLYESASSDAPDYTDRLDLISGTVAGVSTADFDGQADVEGIPANHFVFDETDLASYGSFTAENPAPAVEGDFYLAQDGNYVLSSHSKESSPNRVYEVTEALSFVGQLTEITLPPELVPMTEALDLGVEFGGLLPSGSSLSKLIRYTHGIGVDYYTYTASVRDNDEFLNFYRSLAPTNGWTVAHIGHISTHLEPINCETDIDCVILTNGGEQIVVSYRGRITLEYDHEHVFGPA
ncbi:MAG: hypothetical protein ABI894_09705 [Ilumatobacteraceae bacterium]